VKLLYGYTDKTIIPIKVRHAPSTFYNIILGKSCAELYKSGVRKDGVYTINPDGLVGSFQVRCDMQTDGGGWTVFQRRQDASVDFYRGWQDYKNGFGDLNGNFWLGLDRIHRLTKLGQHVLRADLMDWTNDTAYAKYGSFSVASESDGYRLNLGSFSGKYDLININFIKYSSDEGRNGVGFICLKIMLEEATSAAPNNPISETKPCYLKRSYTKNVGRIKRASYTHNFSVIAFSLM
jgi:hypothetical protein